MVTSDDFMDRLRTLYQQSRRITTAEGEILNEYIGVEETFTLAHSVPTAVTRAPQATRYIWTTVSGATQIKWGEWQWKAEVRRYLLESGLGDGYSLEDVIGVLMMEDR